MAPVLGAALCLSDKRGALPDKRSKINFASRESRAGGFSFFNLLKDTRWPCPSNPRAASPLSLQYHNNHHITKQPRVGNAGNRWCSTQLIQNNMKADKLHERGRKLLRTFIETEFHTPSMDFMDQFEEIHSELEDYYGRDARTIIRFLADYKDLKRLPTVLPIYRGYRETNKRLGVSWTLSQRVAEGFAVDACVFVVSPGDEAMAGKNIPIGKYAFRDKVVYGNAYTVAEYHQLPSKVIRGTCDLLDVLAYTNFGKEQEIIINPAKVWGVVDMPDMTAERVAEIKKADYKIIAEPLEELLTLMHKE